MTPSTQRKIVIASGVVSVIFAFLAIWQRKRLQEQIQRRKSSWFGKTLQWLFPAAAVYRSDGEHGAITSMRINVSTDQESTARCHSPPNSTFHDSSFTDTSTPKKELVVQDQISKLSETGTTSATESNQIETSGGSGNLGASTASSSGSFGSGSTDASTFETSGALTSTGTESDFTSNDTISNPENSQPALSPKSSRSIRRRQADSVGSVGGILYNSGSFVDRTSSTEELTGDSDVLERHEMCDCQAVRDLPEIEDNEAVFEDGLIPDVRPTLVLPVQFSPYRPLDLTEPDDEEVRQGLSPAAINLGKKSHSKTNLLTPFRAILHCIVYASKHGFLIKELADNYSYLETS